jgi:hypothetical protein
MDEENELNKPPEQPDKPTETARKQPPRASLKVSEKGGLSVYGLGRFPVTLYKEQWTRLLGMADEIREFIKANDAALKSKTQ